MVDLIALAVIALAAFLGWRTGLLAALLSFGSIVAAYALAFLLYSPAGRLFASVSGLPPLIAYPLAALLIIMTVVIVAGFYRRRHVKRRRARTFRNWTPPWWDELGGAVVAATWSSFVVLLVVWVLGGLQAVSPRLPDVRGSLIGDLAGELAGKAAFAVASKRLGDPNIARTVAALARDPRDAPQALGNVLKDPRVQKLLRQRWAVAGARRQHVAALARDPMLLQQAHLAGLLKTSPENLSQAEAAAELDAGLAPISRGMRQLADDKEFRKLLNDPKLAQRMQNGDLSQLVSDPRFNELTRRLLSRLARPQPEAER